MKHSNGFGVAENAKPKEPYIEKNRPLFFLHGPEWERDSGTCDIYNYQNMVLIFSKIGAARNLAGRNYAVTNIIT